MKKCSNCNILYDGDEKFCRKCGAQLRPEHGLSPEAQAKNEVFEARLKMDPLNKGLLQDFATFLFEEKLWDECVAVVLKVLAIAPDDIPGHKLLFESYKKLEEFDNALKAGGKLVSLVSPGDALPVLRSLVEMALEKGDLDTALLYLGKIVELQPKDKDAWIKQAQIQSEIGSKKDSVVSWLKAYELGPHHPKAQIYAGIREYQRENYQEASRLIEAGMKQADLKLPEKIIAELVLAVSKARTGELKDDLERLEWIKKYSLDDKAKALLAELYLYQAKKHLAVKEHRDAFYYLDEARQLQESEAVLETIGAVHFSQGKELLNRQSYRTAKASFLKALEHQPENPEYKQELQQVEKRLRSTSRKRKVLAFCLLFLGCALAAVWYFAHGNLSAGINVKSNIELVKGNKIVATQNGTDHFLKKFLFKGKYLLRVTSDGYESYSGSVDIDWASHVKKEIKLTPEYGSIQITSRPSGLPIYLDGKKMGPTPTKLDKILAKDHHIEIRGDGYYWGRTICVRKGKVLDIAKPICAFSLSNLPLQEIIHPDPKTLSYYADFRKSNGGWKNTEDKEHFLKIKGGKLVFGTKSHGSYGEVPQKGKKYGDFVYGATLRKISKGYRDSSYGIFFRVRKAGRSWLFLYFGINDAGKYALRARTIDSGWSGVVLKEGNLGYAIDGRLIHLAVEVIANRVKCFVDGKLVCAATSPSNSFPAYGMVGIDIRSKKVTVEYDDLFVREIPYFQQPGKLIYQESFNKRSEPVAKVTKSKFAKLKSGRLHFTKWNGWVWDHLIDINKSNYSYQITASAKGRRASWGPTILSRNDVSYDGNQKIEKWGCIGMKINKKKEWTVFYYDGNRMQNLNWGTCPAIKPLKRNVFRIDKTGNALRFFVNNAYVMYINLDDKFNTRRLFSGKIGFYVEEGAAAFDNLYVYDLGLGDGELNPSDQCMDIASMLHEAKLLESQGKFKEALQALKRIVDLSPDNEEAQKEYLRLRLKVMENE